MTIDASVIVVLLDIAGKVVAREKVKKERESFEHLTEKVLNATETLISKSGILMSQIKGIGVGIWGVMDRYRGMVRYAVEEESIVSYVSLLDQLETQFDLPTIIEHDATLAAFGEKWSGVGAISDAENMLFLCSDSSCGLIIRASCILARVKVPESLISVRRDQI